MPEAPGPERDLKPEPEHAAQAEPQPRAPNWEPPVPLELQAEPLWAVPPVWAQQRQAQQRRVRQQRQAQQARPQHSAEVEAHMPVWDEDRPPVARERDPRPAADASRNAVPAFRLLQVPPQPHRPSFRAIRRARRYPSPAQRPLWLPGPAQNRHPDPPPIFPASAQPTSSAAMRIPSPGPRRARHRGGRWSRCLASPGDPVSHGSAPADPATGSRHLRRPSSNGFSQRCRALSTCPESHETSPLNRGQAH